jgi:N-methylhydantoinase B
MATDYADWDGRRLPYRPTTSFVPESVHLHRDEGVEIDPITCEVISTKLWNINEEHADTIRRVSGSPITVLVNDFNTCIMTEDGDSFLFAPYIQYFASASEYIIKYTLENRADSIGIHPGDVFIHNDPFIAGSHQQDVGVYAPVFIDGRLFCWVFSACHVRDNGGVEPGGFCVDAPDIYSDPPVVRALKIADGNGMRTDAEDTFLRMSRLPELLALDLRSQIAGANRARTRVEELVDRYGADVVKAVMRKLISDTESSVRERLERLPDGRWSDVVWVSGGASGDRDVRKHVLTLTKRGMQLDFSNHGTDPQFAALNCSFGQFRSAILCALAQLLAFDHRYCVGGFANLVDYDAEVGTLSCGDRDAAYSALHSQILTIYMATKVLSKMMYPDPELRRGVMAASGVASRGWLSLHGTLKGTGVPFANLSLDEIGGFGAFTFKDGIDQGGATFWPKLEVGDCEGWEQYYPILYLYRRAALNGGHGKFRGGHGISVGWLGHGSTDQQFVAVAISPALTVEAGLSGGHWAQTGEFWAAQQTSIRQGFERGELPGSFEELLDVAPGGSFVEPNSSGTPLGEDDVVCQSLFGGGGYGDVLERDPEHVLRDLEDRAVTRQAAEGLYGVVFDADGGVDEDATRALRDERRAARLEESAAPARAFEIDAASLSEPHQQIAEHLAIAGHAGGDAYVCTSCGHGLGPATENYKWYCRVLHGSLTEIDPIFADSGADLNRRVDYRSYICPGCGCVFDNELSLEDEEPVWDTQVASALTAEVAA